MEILWPHYKNDHVLIEEDHSSEKIVIVKEERGVIDIET